MCRICNFFNFGTGLQTNKKEPFMERVSAALDSPVGRLIDNASPKIGAVSAAVSYSTVSWWMAMPWSDVALICSAIGGVLFCLERALRLVVYFRANFMQEKYGRRKDDIKQEAEIDSDN